MKSGYYTQAKDIAKSINLLITNEVVHCYEKANYSYQNLNKKKMTFRNDLVLFQH